jgi:hypothetical protein
LTCPPIAALLYGGRVSGGTRKLARCSPAWLSLFLAWLRTVIQRRTSSCAVRTQQFLSGCVVMNTVPFTLDSAWAGFGQGEGLLRDEGTHLCLEYQLKDAVVGVIKGGLKQVRIPLKDLVSVTLTQGWFGQKWAGVKIVIQAARMDVLQDMPSASQGRIELGISAKDHEAAEKLVADLHQDEEKVTEPYKA